MPRRPPTGCGAPLCANPRPCPDHPARWAEGAPGRAMPPGWTATAARILTRDPICRACLTAPSAEVHHTRGPGHETDADLIGVCAPCHATATAAQAAAGRAAGDTPGAPVASVTDGDRSRMVTGREPGVVTLGEVGSGPGPAGQVVDLGKRQRVGGDPLRALTEGAVPVASEPRPSFGRFVGISAGQRPAATPRAVVTACSRSQTVTTPSRRPVTVREGVR